MTEISVMNVNEITQKAVEMLPGHWSSFESAKRSINKIIQEHDIQPVNHKKPRLFTLFAVGDILQLAHDLKKSTGRKRQKQDSDQPDPGLIIAGKVTPEVKTELEKLTKEPPYIGFDNGTVEMKITPGQLTFKPTNSADSLDFALAKIDLINAAVNLVKVMVREALSEAQDG
jgi:hypothetical protein